MYNYLFIFSIQIQNLFVVIYLCLYYFLLLNLFLALSIFTSNFQLLCLKYHYFKKLLFLLFMHNYILYKLAAIHLPFLGILLWFIGCRFPSVYIYRCIKEFLFQSFLLRKIPMFGVTIKVDLFYFLSLLKSIFQNQLIHIDFKFIE